MHNSLETSLYGHFGIGKRILVLLLVTVLGVLVGYFFGPEMPFSTGRAWWMDQRSGGYGDPIGAVFLGILEGIAFMAALFVGFVAIFVIGGTVVEAIAGNGSMILASLMCGGISLYGALVYNGLRLPYRTILVDTVKNVVVYEQFYRNVYVQTGYKNLVRAESRRDTVEVLGLSLEYALTDEIVVAAAKGTTPRPDVRTLLANALTPIASSTRSERLKFVSNDSDGVVKYVCNRTQGTCPFYRLQIVYDRSNRRAMATDHWIAKHTLDEVITEQYADGAFEFLLNAKAGARTSELLPIVMNVDASDKHLELWTRAPGLTDAQRRSIRDKLVASSDPTYFATAALKRQLVDADRTLMKQILMEKGGALSVLDLDAGAFSFNDEEKRQKVENVLDTSSPRTLSILIMRHGQYVDQARLPSVYEKIATLGSDGDVFRAFVSTPANDSSKNTLFARLLSITDERYIYEMGRESASFTEHQWLQWSRMIVSKVTDIGKLRSLVMRLNLGKTVIGLAERVQEIVSQSEKELLLSLELLDLERVEYVPAGYTLKTTMKLIDAGKLKKNECLRMLSDLRYRNINKIESVKTALEGCPE